MILAFGEHERVMPARAYLGPIQSICTISLNIFLWYVRIQRTCSFVCAVEKQQYVRQCNIKGITGKIFEISFQYSPMEGKIFKNSKLS